MTTTDISKNVCFFNSCMISIHKNNFNPNLIALIEYIENLLTKNKIPKTL